MFLYMEKHELVDVEGNKTGKVLTHEEIRDINNIPKMAFDHGDIIKNAIFELKCELLNLNNLKIYQKKTMNKVKRNYLY